MENTINFPVHVAFIMDGNGRWAEQRGLPRLEGHRAGVKNIRPIVKYLNKHGVRYATLYAFSTENWNRPADEVNGIFHLLESIIAREARELHKNGVRICHIGRPDGISPKLQKSIQRGVKLTEKNTGLTLIFAFNYGGRAEILDALRKFIAGGAPVASLDEKSFGQYLYTAGFPDVDLVIRTGGEIRTSNFMIWQSAYSEYYFTPVLWPDFNEDELENAFLAFGQRQRRFGGLV
jgi:undecaprenyl diphosphate synthase